MGDWSPEERSYVWSHLLNGIGHYQNFLMVIQTNFKANDEAANFDFAQIKTFDLSERKDCK